MRKVAQQTLLTEMVKNIKEIMVLVAKKEISTKKRNRETMVTFNNTEYYYRKLNFRIFFLLGVEYLIKEEEGEHICFSYRTAK